MPFVERVHVVHAGGPVDCMLRMCMDEVALHDLLRGTALSMQDDDLFPFILPETFDFDMFDV